MCGICGILGSPDRDAAARMARAMAHRGPDDESFDEDEGIVLGSRRLAIIDVAEGRQPLVSEDGAVRVVFNGEIYNHRALREDLAARGHAFRSATDGEVLPHLYEEMGAALPGKLNGIFAFALWDRRRRRLLLARDHFGVKPLYYAQRGGVFLFASEIKGILASGLVERALDPEAVGQFLYFYAVPPPLSILSGVRQVPPGSLLVYEDGRAEVRSYWQPPPQSDELITSQDEAAERVRAGLDEAVGRQLMSERPLGVFLSGGLDSSAVVACAASRTSRLRTFAVGFEELAEGRGTPELGVSHHGTEWPWARMVAERFATEHEEVRLSAKTVSEHLTHIFTSMDQPSADGVNSYFVSLAAAGHVTVALSGTGGDELFLGYRRHRLFRERFQDLGSGLDLGADLYARAISLFDEASREAILSASFRRAAGAFRPRTEYLAHVRPNRGEPGDWLSRLEQSVYLPAVLLRDIDAMSMTHSLEVRVPFLDPWFAELLTHVPWQWKLTDGTGKWILKRAFGGLLPAEILERPKRGFSWPIHLWLRSALRPVLHDLLSESRLRRRGVFDPRVVGDLVERFEAGDDRLGLRVWAVLVLEAWANEVLDR